jgi:autophagy-related protein 2
MDLNITETSSTGAVTSFLSLTTPRNLVCYMAHCLPRQPIVLFIQLSNPRPLLKLRFTSVVAPETTAKESRIKLTLWGFTYNFLSDLRLIAELGSFAKSPPGVRPFLELPMMFFFVTCTEKAFESVIPSERTRVDLKIMEGSLRSLAPIHPGAIVFYFGDLDFSTDLVGDSPDTSLHLSVPSLSVLLLDSIMSERNSVTLSKTLRGTSFWKVCFVV